MTILLGWLLFDALVFALLLSQARGLVLASGAALLMALWLMFFAVVWSAFLPIALGAAALRRLGFLEAA